MHVVQSKVKEQVRKLKLRIAADAVQELSARVEQLVRDAARRAKDNGRQTIKKYDL